MHFLPTPRDNLIFGSSLILISQKYDAGSLYKLDERLFLPNKLGIQTAALF